jgi:glycosyltransferase involved in cell wall biosynthesis
VRNGENIGADGNFLRCLEEARGQYVWVMGDDDLLVPGAIADLLSLLEQHEVDLVYLSSFSFSGPVDLEAARREMADKLGRFAEIVTDGGYFLEKVNALIGLISVMLINKNRLEATAHPPIEGLHNSNLMQVGWLFPLLRRKASVLYVWQRLVAYRSYNSGGWGICEVFGVRLRRIANEYFGEEPELARALMNGVLRYWLCDAILEVRRGRHAEMHDENFAADIRHLFARNWRYWVFVWPVAELPMPMARGVHRCLAAVNKVTRVVQGVWRHLFRHGVYLRPRGQDA